MLTENYHFGGRNFLADHPSGIQTIETRHSDVEHDHIGLKLLSLGYSILTIGSLSADFPVGARFEQGPKSTPKNLVVIYDEYAGSHLSFNIRLGHVSGHTKPLPFQEEVSVRRRRVGNGPHILDQAAFWHNPLFAVGVQLPYLGGHPIKKLNHMVTTIMVTTINILSRPQYGNALSVASHS
jgi:hypothetical protein